MRKFLGFVLGAGFVLAGLYIGIAGLRFGYLREDSEQMIVGALALGTLTLIGVIILVIVFRKPKQKDTNAAAAAIWGVAMGSSLGDDFEGGE